MEAWTAGARDAGVRLDKFLAAAERLGSRSRALSALERGRVFVNDVEATGAALRLAEGDRVRLWMDRPGSATRAPRLPRPIAGELEIVYEDEALIVVNKPAGLLSVPSERGGEAASVASRIEAYLRSRQKQRPLVVHRIDRDTTGLVVVAKSARAQRRLIEQFRRHEAERVYRALVHGCPAPPEGEWRDRVVWSAAAAMLRAAPPWDAHAEDAVCRYRVLETFAEATLIEVHLETGKRHQIRLQASLRNHPLVGEPRYIVAPVPSGSIRFARQALHACRLTLRHPADDRTLMFEAPLPGDFEALLARLRRR